MADENSLTPKQAEVVAVLREGRATPKHIREHSSIPSKHAVQGHLSTLRAEDVVVKINTGLYALTEGEQEDEFSPPHATLESTDDGSEELFAKLVDAIEQSDRDAFGRVDPRELEFDDGTKEVGDDG